MAGIDADRKLVIDRKIAIALRKNDLAAESGKGADVSIFIKDMTAEEKEYAYKQYSQLLLDSRYDDDSDGTVTVEEFAKREKSDLLIQMKAQAGNTESTQAQIGLAERHGYLLAQNLDINGDGKISIDEFSYFNKEIDMADDKDNKEQDGILTSASSNALFKSTVGTNVKEDTEHSKKIKEITEKYLSGQNLTEDEQKILNEASTEIRTEEAKRAKEKFGMELGEAKDQTVYHGDLDPDIFKNNGTGGLNNVDPEAMKLLIMNFMQSMFQNNSAIANALTMPGMGGGMGMGGLGGMIPMGGAYQTGGSAINFLADSNQNTKQSGGMKAFQWGNLLGQGLNFATMLRGVFGGGNFGGGLDWWYRS